MHLDGDYGGRQAENNERQTLMSIGLQKGQRASLSKDNAGLGKVKVGLEWDESLRSSGGGGGQNIDGIASAILLQDGRLRDKGDIVYFGNLRHSSGTVQHMGDNLTGAGEGDDGQIVIDLESIFVL